MVGRATFTKMELIEQLRLARLAKRMSQKDVANELCVTNLTFCKWETGTTSPTLEKFIAWSALFNKDVKLTDK